MLEATIQLNRIFSGADACITSMIGPTSTHTSKDMHPIVAHSAAVGPRDFISVRLSATHSECALHPGAARPCIARCAQGRSFVLCVYLSQIHNQNARVSAIARGGASLPLCP